MLEGLNSSLERLDQAYGYLFSLQVLGLGGATLAGVAYPLTLQVFEIVFSNATWAQYIDDLFGLATLGGLCGGAIALAMGLPITLITTLIGSATGVRGCHVWFACLLGGWTGFFALQAFLIISALFHGGGPMWSELAVVGLAVSLGQIGAGVAAWRGMRRRLVGADENPTLRVRANDLFGIAILLVLMAAPCLPFWDDGRIFRQFLLAVAIQLLLLLVGCVVERRRKLRFT
jgi:hypothetical protein